jgi:hypothetical protein
MAENKTRQNDASVDAFLRSIDNQRRRDDAVTVLALMAEITGEPAKMWGTSLIGFGTYHYKYDSGREGDYFITGLSPRKQALTVYIMQGFSRYGDLMSKLGKHKTGKSCLYINKLGDIDLAVLEQLIRRSVLWMRERYPQ